MISLSGIPHITRSVPPKAEQKEPQAAAGGADAWGLRQLSFLGRGSCLAARQADGWLDGPAGFTVMVTLGSPKAALGSSGRIFTVPGREVLPHQAEMSHCLARTREPGPDQTPEGGCVVS